MEIITIANVSGFIAVAIVVVKFLIPNLLVIILANSLGSSNTAVTWSVAARTLYSSNWPTLLRTESSTSTGVKGIIRAVSWASVLGVLLIAVAGIVTPLGLYEDFVSTGSQNASFNYVADQGPFGFARLPRSDLGFNRRCGFYLPILCPGVNDPWSLVNNTNGSITITMDYGYDGRIPQSRLDYFESGLSRNSSTISSLWDIEWRSYNYDHDTTQLPYMNGSKYAVGVFQNFDSMLLRGGAHLIDGLIVNSLTGAIGFRNHTVPASFDNVTSSWEEDLLFAEPESVCIPNNLTLQFTVGGFSDTHNFSDVRLVDNGGFANLDRKFKIRVNGTDAQNNLNLTNRAYIAANLNNFLLAAYYNLTDLNGTYMSSTVGDSYEVGFDSTTPIYWDRMYTTQTFSDFLQEIETDYHNFENVTSMAPNPWNITSDDFGSIMSWCSWFEEDNPGNISTVGVGCDMAYSVAQPLSDDPNADIQGPFGIVRQPGSKWKVDLYSCATAVKADIKTVSFTLNGTALEDTAITSIQDKVYQSPADVPWWGVEKTKMRLVDGLPLWGLVDPDLPQLPNISLVQKEALYLPGLVTNFSAGSYAVENLPGIDFLSPILATLGFLGADTTTAMGTFTSVDYSGVQSVAMLQKWSQLSTTGAGMAQIHQMIWGDIAANTVVGTKGMAGRAPERQVRLSKRDDSEAPPSLPSTQTITLSKRRVLYHWPFAIPALLVAFTFVLVAIAAVLSCCINGSPFHSLRTSLERTSAGRILAATAYPQYAPPGSGTNQWISAVGRREVTFRSGRPTGLGSVQETQYGLASDPMLGCSQEKVGGYHLVPNKA